MIKSIITIVIAIMLLVGVAIFEQNQLTKQFEKFETSLTILYNKTQLEQATKQDGENVRALWKEERNTLHIYVPHRDIEYIDYWLGEAISLIETRQYADALAKIEVLLDICKNTPMGYSIALPNVF